MITVNVDYYGFCKWYFDKETKNNAIENLIAFGNIDVEDIANHVGYLPLIVISNPEVIDKKDLVEGVNLDGSLLFFGMGENIPSGKKYVVKLLGNPKRKNLTGFKISKKAFEEFDKFLLDCPGVSEEATVRV